MQLLYASSFKNDQGVGRVPHNIQLDYTGATANPTTDSQGFTIQGTGEPASNISIAPLPNVQPVGPVLYYTVRIKLDIEALHANQCVLTLFGYTILVPDYYSQLTNGLQFLLVDNGTGVTVYINGVKVDTASIPTDNNVRLGFTNTIEYDLTITDFIIGQDDTAYIIQPEIVQQPTNIASVGWSASSGTIHSAVQTNTPTKETPYISSRHSSDTLAITVPDAVSQLIISSAGRVVSDINENLVANGIVVQPFSDTHQAQSTIVPNNYGLVYITKVPA